MMNDYSLWITPKLMTANGPSILIDLDGAAARKLQVVNAINANLGITRGVGHKPPLEKAAARQ